mmetsp:Transcript_6528/g.5725  ORF Transcript_6528/g.5725 Transcript_6528/m.5725 type:complete len:210 (+) Transcript_6528:244-873(+)
MTQYACSACSVPVVAKSANSGDCAGDFPWWQCCNCATTKNGWAGWNRRACPQCRRRDSQEGNAAAVAVDQNEKALHKRKVEEAAKAQERGSKLPMTRGKARAGGDQIEASIVIDEARAEADAIILQAKRDASRITDLARQEAERIVEAVTPRGLNGRSNLNLSPIAKTSVVLKKLPPPLSTAQSPVGGRAKEVQESFVTIAPSLPGHVT